MFGVFLGCVIAPLVAMGRARQFVCISLGTLGGCGAIAMAAGIVALALQQPYGVYYPLLFMGGMSAFFGFGGLLMAVQRYRQHDLRRISALDVV